MAQQLERRLVPQPMKQLTLLRHGKSDWNDCSLSDFERPLKPRGRRDAMRMGEHLASPDLAPDLIVCSPAARARQTALLFAEAVGYDEDIQWDKRIYGADGVELMAVLRQLPEDVDNVVLIGHNPGLEELVERLAAGSPNFAIVGVRLPTAAAAHILLDLNSWSEAQTGCGRLDWLITPADLCEK